MMKWVGLAAAALLIFAGFTEWVFIASKNISVTGVSSEGTNLGKPAYLHFIFTAFFIVFSLVPRVWAKRGNLLAAALNAAWAVRNFFIVTACSAGDCPEKRTGIYLVLIAAVFMLAGALFPDIKVQNNTKR